MTLDTLTLLLRKNALVDFDIDKNIIYNTKDKPSHHSNALTVYVYTYNGKILFKKSGLFKMVRYNCF